MYSTASSGLVAPGSTPITLREVFSVMLLFSDAVALAFSGTGLKPRLPALA